MNKTVSLTVKSGKTITKFNINANGVTITRHKANRPGRPGNVLRLTLDEMKTIYGELSELASNDIEN